MRGTKSASLAAAIALIALLPLSARGDDELQWRRKFKRARHSILVFNVAVNNYYNAVLFQGAAGPREKKMMIDGSIAARRSLNSITECPEEFAEACQTYTEMYETLRKMELMAENRQVAFNQLEEWKALKKKVEDLMDRFEELLELK